MTYDPMINPTEFKIATKIQQRRLQIVVHTCAHDIFNKQTIDPETFMKYSNELHELQKMYPDIAANVIRHDEFKGWVPGDEITFFYDDATLNRAAKLPEKEAVTNEYQKVQQQTRATSSRRPQRKKEPKQRRKPLL